ncbi:hypothetical protein I7V34_14615 [Bacillus sp. V3]|nr:hypothetical protein I7V34_14615 [Bacillus sp. V3]
MTAKIAYYISDYGFGHATRSAGIIKGLLKEKADIEITICNSFAMPFLRRNFQDSRVKFRSTSTDIGYFLNKDTIEPDIFKLNHEYDLYMKQWNDRVSEEKAFLMDEKVDLVLSDIVAMPFEAANQIDIPSVGISNFTWYTAYEGLISRVKLGRLKDAYDSMTAFFMLAGANEPEWKTRYTKSFGFFSREINREEVARIRKMLNPYGEKNLVYFGLGMKIENNNIEQFEFWNDPNTIFIVSSNTSIERENVYRIPTEYVDSHHFIAAADLAITKAGWGSISEAIIGNTPLLIINRQSMKEDRNTVSYLKERRLCKTIEWTELQQLNSLNQVIELYEVDEEPQGNNLYDIVQNTMEILKR